MHTLDIIYVSRPGPLGIHVAFSDINQSHFSILRFQTTVTLRIRRQSDCYVCILQASISNSLYITLNGTVILHFHVVQNDFQHIRTSTKVLHMYTY
jgi:hypothetical protein